MSEPFVREFRARWVDMDYNQHMRNAAFLGYSEEARLQYIDHNGWSMADLAKLHLGPVVLEDRLVYRKELKLLESFQVDLALAATTPDARRMRLRNRFVRNSDGALCAVVDSLVLWFDLVARAPATPPPALRDIWLRLARTDDFAELE